MKKRAARGRPPKDVIAAVRAWQSNHRSRPLTCGNDGSHAPLEPIEEESVVVLRCPTCGYRQTGVPDTVIRSHFKTRSGGRRRAASARKRRK